MLLLLVACKGDDEVTWSLYNADSDLVTVSVGGAVLDPVATVLHSNTGEVEIGAGSVDPGGGPIGTVHQVLVTIDDAYKDTIDRASVRIDSGERGEDEYDLTADSTGEGIWVLELDSVGDEGETRDDTFTFRVWTVDE